MRKSTAALSAALLGAGGAVFLSVAVPAVANASGCGDTVVSPTDTHGFYSQNATWQPGGIQLTVSGPADQAYLGYEIGGSGVPLADQTAQSNYVITANGQDNGFNPGMAYYLGITGGGAGESNLFYEPQSYGDGIWHTGAPGAEQGYSFAGTLDEYVALHPAAAITEFDANYGSGAPAGQELVSRIKFGCNNFIFQGTQTPPAENQPPVAAFTYNNAGDADYQTFAFDASTSSDPDAGDTLSYEWDFNNDGVVDSTDKVTTYAFPGAGNYPVTLTVRDQAGAFNQTSQPVLVQDTTNSSNGGPLANTGADVLGLAGLGALAVAGAGAGLVVNRRRKASTNA